MNNRVNHELFFRSMTVIDVPHVLDIENRSFTLPWSEEAYFYELSHNQYSYYIVAVIDNKVIGYCGSWLIYDDAQITTIAVCPNFRGRQIGQAILRYVMAMLQQLGAKKITLEVRVSNRIAQSVYEKMGFIVCGQRKAYYPDNQEDALMMRVNLGER